ncbi:MAG TPA: lytic transglycosylase domain-containing protein, partial [Thermoanaerobaculia bacterium]|nr:lytic transglycosylase domain-containing protein [Thermoanaerobaculia bacterium]
KDLLTLPIADPVRIEVLEALISIAESKQEDDDERALVTDLARLDPSQEAGLQHFWDEGWDAYTSGDLHKAVDLLRFIRETYRNPNVKRQADYWRARSIERLGQKEEAETIYGALGTAPYDDLYAVLSEQRVRIAHDPDTNPLRVSGPDWPEIAEARMPDELRLAYELTALDDERDARLEIQKNIKPSNETFADALLADLYHSSGDMELMARSLRRAFPQLATVEQDSVPRYFLSMYYPMRYQRVIVQYAQKNRLDPFLVMALIHQESAFIPTARSAVGASGLMQMMSPTAKELAQQLHSSANVENPEVAIRLGTFYFRQLVDVFDGSIPLAIAAYNAGRGNVAKWRHAAPKKPMDEFLESMPFAETRNYVKRVMLISSTYRRMTL